MSLSRKMTLGLVGNRLINSFLSKYGMKLGAARFVAGESLDHAIQMVQKLNREGFLVTLDHLGESVYHRVEALKAKQAILNIYDMIEISTANANVSIKLTQLGLDIDKDFCLANLEQITEKAKQKNNFVRIDMEDSPRIEATLQIFDTLLEKFTNQHIGIVIQAYLYRSENDVIQLGKKGVNLRIVKGAYKEPATVAFAKKKDVDQNFIHLVQLHLKNGCYTAIATHDEVAIQQLKSWIKENHIPDDLYEFQMLYGVRPQLQKQLLVEGYKVKIYTPYGKDWYPYFTRRIAERPANALFVLKSFFQK